MTVIRDTLRGRGQQGFTLVEVTIILLVLVIISMIMLPQLGNFNRLARKVKVYEDVGAICASMKKFLDEVMVNGPYIQPGGTVAPPVNPVGLLVGPGSIPSIGPTAANPPRTGGGFPDIWNAPAPTPDAFDVTTDSGEVPLSVDFDADRFEFHMQVNNPTGLPPDTFVDRYKNVIDDPTVGAFAGWRGPYFNEWTSDPWGTRYSSNTFGLFFGPSGFPDDIFSTAVVCISFGPNKLAETPANQPIDLAPYGWYFLGDDVGAVLSAVGPF